MAHETVSNAQEFESRVGSRLAGLNNYLTKPFEVLRKATSIKRHDPLTSLPQDMSAASRIARYEYNQQAPWKDKEEDFLIEAEGVGKMRVRLMTEARDKDVYLTLAQPQLTQATLELAEFTKPGHRVEIALALDGIPPFVVTYSGNADTDGYFFQDKSSTITIAGVDPNDLETRTTDSHLVIYPEKDLVEIRTKGDKLLDSSSISGFSGSMALFYEVGKMREWDMLDIANIQLGGDIIGFDILKDYKPIAPIILPMSFAVGK